jgi:hypothetical protein
MNQIVNFISYLGVCVPLVLLFLVLWFLHDWARK